MPDPSTSYERRSRVVIHLPLNNAREEMALAEVVRYLKGRRTSKVGVTGFTLSDYPLTSFTGLWWSSEQTQWIEDGIVLCFIDLLAETQAAIDAEVGKIRQRIIEAYRVHGSPQEEVWVVAHPVIRFA